MLFEYSPFTQRSGKPEIKRISVFICRTIPPPTKLLTQIDYYSGNTEVWLTIFTLSFSFKLEKASRGETISRFQSFSCIYIITLQYASTNPLGEYCLSTRRSTGERRLDTSCRGCGGGRRWCRPGAGSGRTCSHPLHPSITPSEPRN